MVKELVCPNCGSKRVRILRYVFQCRSCKFYWDKKNRNINKYSKASRASFRIV